MAAMTALVRVAAGGLPPSTRKWNTVGDVRSVGWGVVGNGGTA